MPYLILVITCLFKLFLSFNLWFIILKYLWL